MKSKPDIDKGKLIIDQLIDWLGIPNASAETSERVAKMYVELCKGLYEYAPIPKLFKANIGYVCVTDIVFSSLCEHHLLPFFGKCGVVYWTEDNMVLGLSKIARIIEWCSARPNLQENLTREIADRIWDISGLNVKGIYVVMSAEHTCMTIRGIKAKGSVTNTAFMAGDIDKEEAVRVLTAKSFFKE